TGPRHRVADQQRPLVTNDLHPHVMPPGTRARDVQCGDAAAVETNGDGGIVEIAELRELRIDRRLSRRVRLDRLLAEKPARGVVVMRGHVDEEATAGDRILRRRRADVARDADDQQRPADRALRYAAPRLRPAGIEAPVVAD